MILLYKICTETLGTESRIHKPASDFQEAAYDTFILPYNQPVYNSQNQLCMYTGSTSLPNLKIIIYSWDGPFLTQSKHILQYKVYFLVSLVSTQNYFWKSS